MKKVVLCAAVGALLISAVPASARSSFASVTMLWFASMNIWIADTTTAGTNTTPNTAPCGYAPICRTALLL